MKQITVKKNQTIFDLAAQWYGNCQAVDEILGNNPNLVNDDQVKARLGITDDEFYFDLAIKPGTVLVIDPDSRQMKRNVVREMEGVNVTTFEL